jgi:DtxR family transcriptional regulator, Mn-dependent transcriptional regulator
MTTTYATDDYLKTIFTLTRSAERAGTKDIADRLHVSQASVTAMLQRLAGMTPPLIQYRKHGGAALTHEGEQRALELLRHHRLLETFLHNVLGYEWDEVHEEACRLEHVISERMEERIAALLGHPTHDPHGDPIPDRHLLLPRTEQTRLSELRAGDKAVITRVCDRDPALLRYLAKVPMRPGMILNVLSYSDVDGNLTVRIQRRCSSVVLGPAVTDAVFVNRVGTA